MDRILRAVFQIGNNPEPEEAKNNWIKLIEYDLEFEDEEDLKIFKYLTSYYDQMSSPPDFLLMKEYFENENDIETVSRLDEVSAAQVHIRTNYLSIIKAEQQKQLTKKMVILCRDATTIAEHGKNIEQKDRKKLVLRGPNDAANYLFENLAQFTKIESGTRLEGVISEDAEEVFEQYEFAEKNKQFLHRNLFGLEPVDEACSGHKRGEFWIHTAFTGELKTSLALNYAYNNAMVYGKNIFYAILEMPYDQLRRQLYVIHSSHGKFVTEWHKEDGYTGLNYIQVRDGLLTKKDKERYRIIVNDFKESCKGRLFVWRPKAGTGIQDIARKAEMFHNRWGCDGIVIDHLGLVKTRSNRDYVVALNEVVQESRQVALDFARGQGVPLLALFQMNRQGKLRADKNDGYYDMSAISYANECLIGSTLIPTDRGLIQIQNVKPGKDQVWSRTGWKQVLNLFNNGKRKVFEITDSRGFSVIATEDHRLRTMENGIISWTSVKDLTPDSFLLSGFNRNFPIEFPSLPKLNVGKWERITNTRGETLKVPDVMNDDLAFLMGAFVGDGVFKKKTVVVGWCGNRKEIFLKKKIETAIEKVFNQHFSSLESPSRKSVFDLLKNSKSLMRWFEEVGMDRKPGIPDSILRSPESAVRCFLRGLWDTDGSINSQGIISLKLKEKHKITLQQVQILLSGLGIDSTLSNGIGTLKGKKFGFYCLRIRSRESRERFYQLVGFTEPAKMKKLESVIDSVKSSAKFGNGTLWPIGTMFHRICKKYKRSDLPRKVRSISKDRKLIPHGVLISFISFLKEMNDEEAEFLHDLINTSRPSKLKSVIFIGIDEVFDIEVTGDHEYESSGLLSHNCEKSADVITYTYLNEVLRKEGKFYLGNLKNREGPIFDRMIGKILWHSKRMRAIENNVISLDNAEILAAANEIAGLTIQNLLAS